MKKSKCEASASVVVIGKINERKQSKALPIAAMTGNQKTNDKTKSTSPQLVRFAIERTNGV